MKVDSISLRLGYLTTRYPVWVICCCFLGVFVLSMGIRNLSFDSEYRAFFSENNPQLQAFDFIQEVYSKSDNVLFIIEPQDTDVFNPEILAAVVELTELAWQLPYSSRVDSLSNFQHTRAMNDELVVSDLFSSPSLLNDQDIQYIKQTALNEPLLVNRLISSFGHVTGVNVTIQAPEKDLQATLEIAEKAREIAFQIEDAVPGLKVHITGVVMINNAFIEAALDDNRTLVPVMYAIIIVLLMVFLRSFVATVCVFVVILLSTVSALGIFGWLGWVLTPPSASAPTIVLTMAVADCVHVLVTILHQLRSGQVKTVAIQESLRVNFQPVLLTSVTTIIGFLSMNFSDAPPYRDLGNLAALGIAMAFILTLFLLPALLTVLPIRFKAVARGNSRLMEKAAEWVIRHSLFLLVTNGLLVLILSSLAPLNRLNDDLVKYFDETMEVRRATDFLNANMGGIHTIEIALSAAEEGGLNDPLFLQSVERLSRWLEKQPEVLHVNTITDIFKRLNKNMHQDDSSEYRLPMVRELAAQYLLMYEMSLPYGLDLNDQVNLDKSGTRVIVTMQSLGSSEMVAVESRLQGWLDANMSEITVKMASPALMFSHIGERNIISMIGGTLLALVLISFILIGAFRSVKFGLLSLIPNLAPAGVGFGLWALIDGNIGLGLSIVMGMTLGIVVDDTVHFISKYRRARVEQQLSSNEAVSYAFITVGAAMWITSIVLVIGFLVLSFSHFAMNADMGLLTAITIATALWMDLLLLPPILMATDRK